MTIFDLPTMSEAEAWVMIRATLERLPQLSRLYDELFLGRLVRRRQMDNSLLLLLVQPNNEYAGFWYLGLAGSAYAGFRMHRTIASVAVQCATGVYGRRSTGRVHRRSVPCVDFGRSIVCGVSKSIGASSAFALFSTSGDGDHFVKNGVAPVRPSMVTGG